MPDSGPASLVVPQRGQAPAVPARKGRGLALLYLALLLAQALPCLCAPALAAGLIQEEIALPAVFDGAEESLEALVVRPDDNGRHPLMLINHGSPRDVDKRESMAPQAMLREAEEFARRGFAAVLLMRRGYGQSGGDFAEGYGSCSHPDYLSAGRRSAQDLREAVRLLREKPFVNPDKVVSVGRSAGGFASVALAADPPPGLVAVINFAGGRGSLEDGEVCNQDALVRAFGRFGATARVPMLWVYARNDQYFGPDLAQALHQAFTAAGGKAELVQAPDFGEDGHTLFSRKGIPVWTPYVDAFLGKLGLVSGAPPPPAAPRARATPPGALSANGRKAFAEYLDAPGHKAFAMSSKGSFSWRSGRRTPEEAVQEAREACAEHAEASCRVVMLDDAPQ